MSCPDELTLSIYADGELSGGEAARIAKHLEICRACGAALESLRAESVVLREVLGEDAWVSSWEPAPVAAVRGARDGARKSHTSAAPWLWGAVAAVAMTPLLLDWVWQGTPTLPAGFSWLWSLGFGGIVSGSRTLMDYFVGGQDMWTTSMGFTATLWVVIGALGAMALRRPKMAAISAVAFGLFVGWVPAGDASAAEFRFEKDGTVEVSSDESIDDTVFLGGKTAIVAGAIDGDVFAAGERVEVTGNVNGNVYSAGESVTVTGEVTGNVHAAGETVEVGSKVGGSGYLAGESVTLREGARLARGGFFAGETVRAKGDVGRALFFAAEDMELTGRVERDVNGVGDQVRIGPSGSVGGDLRVKMSDVDALDVADGAQIAGETVVEKHEHEERRAFLYPGFYLGVLAKTLAMLLIALVLVAMFPRLLPSAPESSREVLRDMGIGFVALVATPVVALIIALSIIGIPIAIVLGMAYGLLLLLSMVAVAYFAGERLPIGGDGQTGVVLRTGLALLAILLVIEIPFVGGGLHFLVHIFGMGCLLIHLRNLYLSGRGRGPTATPTDDAGALVAG